MVIDIHSRENRLHPPMTNIMREKQGIPISLPHFCVKFCMSYIRMGPIPHSALTCCCPRYGCNKYANSIKLGAGEKPQNVVVSNFIWVLRYTASKIICKEGSANVH